MTLTEFMNTIYPLLLDRIMDKIEKKLDDGTVIKAYWVPGANPIIRVDIKPV